MNRQANSNRLRFTLATLCLLMSGLVIWMAAVRSFGPLSITLMMVSPLPAAGYVHLVRKYCGKREFTRSLTVGLVNILLMAGLLASAAISVCIFGAGLLAGPWAGR